MCGVVEEIAEPRPDLAPIEWSCVVANGAFLVEERFAGRSVSRREHCGGHLRRRGSLPLLLCGVPSVEVGLGLHVDVAIAHARVADAAEFRAHDLKLAQLCR